MSKHLIFGTGPLGQAVMRALLKKDDARILMVNRSGRRDGIPTQVEVVASDAYKTENVITLTEDADVVYQCAQPPYHRWQEDFPPLQTAILNGVKATGAKLIVGENLYAYGEVDGLIHENLPFNAHTRKGKVRAAMTRQLMEAYEKGEVQVAMARGSDFYGIGVKESALGERVLGAITKDKTAQATGNIDLPHTQTVIDDFGTAMVILGERDEANGQAWHVPNPPTRTTRELIECAAQIAGVEAKVGSAGKNMMRFFGMFSPGAREMVEMMYEFEKPFVVDHSKFVKVFGDISTPHEQALTDTIAWYRQQG